MQEMPALVAPRQHGIGRGWYWTRRGFDLFNRGRGVSVAMVLCWLVTSVLLERLPAGGLISNLLYMVWMAGWMVAAHHAWEQQGIVFGDLFAGFRRQLTPLVLGGLVISALMLAIVQLVMGLLSYWGVDALLGQDPATLTMTPEEAQAVLLAILAGLVLAVPLLMAVTFAPALIFFHRLPVLLALRLSFLGCLRNMWPFLTWSVLACLLLLLGGMLLVVGLLVVMPALNYSIYVAYREIYLSDEAMAPEAPVTPTNHFHA
ncbi:BPSS1780 family membrane protein [Aeromonas diversa]|uniref:BPSS1780 family membrane protein n=1 Tax=Aeromonas diversa TaxID=502790 RepID=UPI003462326D